MASASDNVPLDDLFAHRAWVRRVARALVHDESTAADLEQRVWLKAIEKPPRHRRSLRGWLGSVLRNAASDMRRADKRRSRHEKTAAAPELPRGSRDPVAEAEIHKRVLDAVLGLSEPYRTTVLLRYFDDLRPGEVAIRMGAPVETVRTRIRRALEQLRAGFDRDHGGNRRAWCMALLPLFAGSGTATAAGAVGGTFTTLAGITLMSAKLKVGAAVVLAVALSLAVWQGLDRGADPAPPPADGTVEPVPAEAEPDPGVGGDEPKEAAAPSAPPARPADVIAEHSRVSGRVLYDDGTPARGICVTAYFGEHLLRVRNHSNTTLTDDEGRFSFPAVRGAPYRVGPLSDGLNGVIRWTKDLRKDARGGADEVSIRLPRVGTMILSLTDSATGEPVECRHYYLRWKKDGRSQVATGFPYAALPRLHRAPMPKGDDAAEVLLTEDRFRVQLPPIDGVDPDSNVRLVVRADAKVYESTVIEIPRSKLGMDLGERKVSMRPLPPPDGGWSLRVDARYTDGAPYSGAGRVRVNRNGEEIQDIDFEVTDGEAHVSGLALGADEVWVRAGRRNVKLPACPAVEGEVQSVEIRIPRTWKLVVDPRFEGEPRQLTVKVTSQRSSSGALVSSMTVGAGSWPKTIAGSVAGEATVTLHDDDGVVATEKVTVTLGRTVTVRPVVPPKGR